jgi:hypothetical protein
MEPEVELGEVEAEELDASHERRNPSVRDAGAPVLLEAVRNELQIVEQLFRTLVAVVAEAPPHECELSPIGLALVQAADLGGVRRQLPGVALQRRLQLGRDAGQRTVERERHRQLADLGSVASEHELPRTGERLANGLGARVRVAVGVSADPAPEGDRRPTGHMTPVLVQQLLGTVQEAVLEEPQAVPDLVDHARPLVPDLVRLPEHRDLLAEACLDRFTIGGGLQRIVQLAEQLCDPDVSEQDRPPRRLRRMGGEHQLDVDVRQARAELVRRYVCQLREGVVERLTRCDARLCVLAPPAKPVVLLCDVRELEVEAERAQHEGLPLRRESGDLRGDVVQRRSLPRLAREQANALDFGQQLRALLLDEHLSENRSEQTHVPPERRGRLVSRGRLRH